MRKICKQVDIIANKRYQFSRNKSKNNVFLFAQVKQEKCLKFLLVFQLYQLYQLFQLVANSG